MKVLILRIILYSFGKCEMRKMVPIFKPPVFDFIILCKDISSYVYIETCFLSDKGVAGLHKAGCKLTLSEV